MKHPVSFPSLSPDADPDDPQRRLWLGAAAATAGAAAVGAAIPLASSFAPSERALAMGASVQTDVSDLAPGAMKTVEWRGKPVWVVRRTQQMLDDLPGLDAQLVDPASKEPQQPSYATNPHRSVHPEFFVAIGICTHLGCSPNSVPAASNHPGVPADWKGGFFCPCHGSTFDMAGRVFKNKPAPSNLEIPPHHYVSETCLVIGDHPPTA